MLSLVGRLWDAGAVYKNTGWGCTLCWETVYKKYGMGVALAVAVHGHKGREWGKVWGRVRGCSGCK